MSVTTEKAQVGVLQKQVGLREMADGSERPDLPVSRRDSMLRTLKEDLWSKYKTTREIPAISRSQGKTDHSLRAHKSVADFRQMRLTNNAGEEGTRSLPARRSFPGGMHKIVEMKPATSYISHRTKDIKETLRKMGGGGSLRQNSRRQLSVNSFSDSGASREETVSVNDNAFAKRKQFTRKLSRLKQMGSSTSSESDLADGSSQDSTGLGMIKMAGVLKRKLTLKKLGLAAAKAAPKAPRSFRRLARFIVIFFRVWRLHSYKIRTSVQAVSATKGGQEKDMDLLFDKSIFKANKEMRLSGETIRILRKRPLHRTQEELHNVKVALMNYPSLSEFPEQMQQMIVRKAWYDTVDAERVIVREGQRALYFYFILSGTVVKKAMDDERQQSRTLAFLTRGESFGDVDIIEQRPRDCTIIAMETTELMCMSAKDFVEIFQSGGLKDVNDPFFQSVNCLQGWPLHLLANNPKKAVLRFFKRGMVLVKDSNMSDWLYIIKSGSCKVLKKLKKVKPKLKVRRPELKIPQVETLMPVKQTINPRIPHTDLLDTWLQHEKEKVIASETSQRGLYRYDAPEINVGTLSTYRRPSELSVVRENSLLAPQLPGPFLTKMNKPPRNGPNGERDTSAHQQIQQQKQPQQQQQQKETELLDEIAKGEKETDSDGQAPMKKVKFTENLPKSRTTHSDYGGRAQKEDPAMFVTVKILTKGAVFGLTEFVYGKQTSLSLVSNGAECIVIDKKFFSEHAPQTLMNRLREEIYPFPGDEELQHGLQTRVSWEAHKQATFDKTMRAINIKKTNLQDARATLKHAFNKKHTFT